MSQSSLCLSKSRTIVGIEEVKVVGMGSTIARRGGERRSVDLEGIHVGGNQLGKGSEPSISTTSEGSVGTHGNHVGDDSGIFRTIIDFKEAGEVLVVEMGKIVGIGIGNELVECVTTKGTTHGVRGLVKVGSTHDGDSIEVALVELSDRGVDNLVGMGSVIEDWDSVGCIPKLDGSCSTEARQHIVS